MYSVVIGPYQPPCIDCLTSSQRRALNAVAVDSAGSVIAVGSFTEGMDPDPTLNATSTNPPKFDSSLYYPTSGAQLTAGNAFISKLSAGKYPTTVRSSLNPAGSTQAITFTADIQSTVLGGTVTFMDGSMTLGTANMMNGTATFTTTLSAGGHKITAVYSGDGKVSPPIFQVVTSQ